MYAAVENNSGNVPAFLIKLWTLVEDPSTDELIHWDASGTSFHVYDQQRFSREILPLYFKHNNIASFIRQLNMYGFRKVTHIDQGGLKIEKDDLQFQHQYFQRGEREMLQYIKRKVSPQAVRTTDHLAAAKTDEVSRVLTEMKQVKTKQDSMDQNLEYIKRENKLLWREVAMLRQKHHKQQQIVNKLIQFLVSLVSSSRTGLTIPSIRRVPLAINDVSQLMPQTKSATVQSTTGIQGAQNTIETLPIIVTSPSPAGAGEGLSDDTKYKIESPKIDDILLSPTPSMSGPIIHELPDPPQTILMPAGNIGLVTQPVSSVANQGLPYTFLTSNTATTVTPTLVNSSIVLVPTVQTPAQQTTATHQMVAADPSNNFLMSPKIEAAPSLEDALTFGLNVPSSSQSTPHIVSAQPQTGVAGSQKRKRKGSWVQPQDSGVSPTKRSLAQQTQQTQQTQQSVPLAVPATSARPMSDAQAASLSNLVRANSDLNSSGNGEVGAGSSDASLALAASKDNDEFSLSSDQLDLLSSDLDGLKGILQEQYKVDPTFLMDLFDSSNPWPVIPEKDLDELKADKDEAGTSGLEDGHITGTELVEYNPRDELFPELMDDNIIGDIDDID